MARGQVVSKVSHPAWLCHCENLSQCLCPHHSVHEAFPSCGCRPLKCWENSLGSSCMGLTPCCPPWHQGELLLPPESLHPWTPGESLLLAASAFLWQGPPDHRTNGSRDAGNHFQPQTAAKELGGRMWEAQRVMVNAAVTAASLAMPFLKDSMHEQRDDLPCPGRTRGSLATGLTIPPILSPMPGLVKGHPHLRGC